MTSRTRLWVVLGLIASPFVLAATTGCFSKPDPPMAAPDNALRCNCACEGVANDRKVVIGASAQDAEEAGDQPVELTSSDLDIGEKIVGLRFEGVAIPPKATIVSAYVQFDADGNTNVTTNVAIGAQLSTDAPPFTTAVHDLSTRISGLGSLINWPAIPTWTGGDRGTDQRTPELKDAIQELVDQASWKSTSPIVLIINGSGARAARAFDGTPARAPTLVVTYDATINADIPVCAKNPLSPGTLNAECALVEQTFEGLAEHCGYPSACDCKPVDVPDQDDSFYSNVCVTECVAEAADATCSNFDPYSFVECLQGAPLDDCKHFVAATNAADDDDPVCVASGSALAFHMYGQRSRCELSGTSEIHVGDREPEKAPETNGIVEVVGGSCDGCKVHPFIDLRMDDITFEIKWHSDPTFTDLSASAHGTETAAVTGGEAVFGSDTVDGTGNGRRGALGAGMVVNSTNDEPLKIGLDWSAKLCDLTGRLATSVDGERPEGLCDNDDTIVCNEDADCVDVGGACTLQEEDDEEAMTVDVNLRTGTLANQPPFANAGADQPAIECTSPAGASFVLDGRGTSDPDGDLALVRWRRGTRLGTQVSNDLVAVESLGINESETWYLLAIDTNAQTDIDATETTVVDTTAPVIACNLPATINPPKAPISFTATATDVCDSSVTPQGGSFACYGFTKKGVRYDVACNIELNGPKITIRNSGGVGTFIDWNLTAADDSGNTSPPTTCRTKVVNPIKG